MKMEEIGGRVGEADQISVRGATKDPFLRSSHYWDGYQV